MQRSQDFYVYVNLQSKQNATQKVFANCNLTLWYWLNWHFSAYKTFLWFSINISKLIKEDS